MWRMILLVAVTTLIMAQVPPEIDIIIFGNNGGTVQSAPPTCNGAIDLSTGCTQPMFGGL